MKKLKNLVLSGASRAYKYWYRRLQNHQAELYHAPGINLKGKEFEEHKEISTYLIKKQLKAYSLIPRKKSRSKFRAMNSTYLTNRLDSWNKKVTDGRKPGDFYDNSIEKPPKWVDQDEDE